ncbi:MAG: DNA-binding protein HU-beta [Myxococcota bacterium]|jgi:DNA-binding protein HU-beta
MNKGEMVAELASKTGLSKAKSLEVINSIFDAEPGKGIIAVELDAGKKVVIPGFGTFGTRQRGARTGTNPATGASISIPEKNYAYFRPGKTLRERVEN